MNGREKRIVRRRVAPLDAAREARLAVVRRPWRTIANAIAPLIGVAAVVTVIGLGDSAKGAVTSAFDRQIATQVTFVDTLPTNRPEVLTTRAVERLRRDVAGVEAAGLIWNVQGGRPQTVVSASSPGAPSTSLPLISASPGALIAMNTQLSFGRTYDVGMVNRSEPVCLLGQAAASQLGISNTFGDPQIVIAGVRLTVVGIVKNVSQQAQVLLGIVVPPNVARWLDPSPEPRSVIVDTKLGAAAGIGLRGPSVLAPYDPSRIDAEVPPDPSLLRAQIESSVGELLRILALGALLIGAVGIFNSTTIGVVQRRGEIGLRSAIGFTRGQIALTFLLEAAFVGAIGGFLGDCVGVCAIAATSVGNGWQAVLAWQVLLAAPFAGLVVGLVAGTYPSLRAAATPPIAALRSG